MYTWRDILDTLESGATVSMTVVAYDRQRKSGGEKKYIAEAILHRRASTEDGIERASSSRALTGKERSRQLLYEEKESRSPRHGKHFTRNVRLLINGHPTSDIRKIHIPLIVEFLGENVVP